MFCTAHHQPRPATVKATAPAPGRRVRTVPQQRRAPGQIFTDFASI